MDQKGNYSSQMEASLGVHVVPSSKHINLHPRKEIVPPARVCNKNFKEYVPFGFGIWVENAFIREVREEYFKYW